MPEQLRYNTGKPKLSYLYANSRAIRTIRYDVAPTYDAMAVELQKFLAGGPREHLECAAGAARMALELELGGEIHTRYTKRGRIVVDCYNADNETCKVYEFGERKYERGNYRKGAPLTNYIDSTLRHYREIRKHREHIVYEVAVDAESMLAHGAHIFWNLWQALDQPDSRDDRLAPVAGGEYDQDIFSNSNDKVAEVLEMHRNGWLAAEDLDSLLVPFCPSVRFDVEVYDQRCNDKIARLEDEGRYADEARGTAFEVTTEAWTEPEQYGLAYPEAGEMDLEDLVEFKVLPSELGPMFDKGAGKHGSEISRNALHTWEHISPGFGAAYSREVYGEDL